MAAEERQGAQEAAPEPDVFTVESEEDEDVLFDRKFRDRSLVAMANEMERGQRFDADVFANAGGLVYDVEKLETSEGERAANGANGANESSASTSGAAANASNATATATETTETTETEQVGEDRNQGKVYSVMLFGSRILVYFQEGGNSVVEYNLNGLNIKKMTLKKDDKSVVTLYFVGETDSVFFLRLKLANAADFLEDVQIMIEDNAN